MAKNKKYKKTQKPTDPAAYISAPSGEIGDLAPYIASASESKKDNIADDRFSADDFTVEIEKKGSDNSNTNNIDSNNEAIATSENIEEHTEAIDAAEVMDYGYVDGYQQPEGEIQHDKIDVSDDRHNNRVAIMNLDWNHTKASDIYMVLSSFLPPGGKLEEVRIYQSDFGHKMLAKERISGPPLGEYISAARKRLAAQVYGKMLAGIVDIDGSTGKKTRSGSRDTVINSLDEILITPEQYENRIKSIVDNIVKKEKKGKKGKISVDKLMESTELVDAILSKHDLIQQAADQAVRNCELDRLRYYYGVAIFNSGKTANAVVTNVDGLDFERSGLQFDLRYIDDDLSFADKDIWDTEDQENGYLHDVCDAEPTRYEIKDDFETGAVQKLKNIQLEWDRTDSARTRITKKKSYTDEEIQQMEDEGAFAELLADEPGEDLEEEDENEDADDKSDKEDISDNDKVDYSENAKKVRTKKQKSKKDMEKLKRAELDLLLGKANTNNDGDADSSSSDSVDDDDEADGFIRKSHGKKRQSSSVPAVLESDNDKKSSKKKEKDFVINFTSILDKETTEKLNKKAQRAADEDNEENEGNEEGNEDENDVIVFTRKQETDQKGRPVLTPFQKMLRERQENLLKKRALETGKKPKEYDEFAAIERKLMAQRRNDDQVNIFKDAAGAEHFIIEADMGDEENDDKDKIQADQKEKQIQEEEEEEQNTAGTYNAVVVRQVKKIKEKIEEAASNEKGKHNPKLRRKLQRKLDQMYEKNPWLKAAESTAKSLGKDLAVDSRFSEMFVNSEFTVDHSDKNFNNNDIFEGKKHM